MVALNSQVRMQTKTGTDLGTVSLESFWAGTGASGTFDPKLTYDPFNNRWIFSAVSDGRSATSSILIGASQTSDPTGTWNLYRIDADATDTDWADFPRVGFNKDWVVVTVNMFANLNDASAGSIVIAIEKADLFNGISPLTQTVLTDPNSAPTPAETYDNSLATLYLVRNWNGNSGGNGFLRMSSITGTVGAEVYTADGAFVSTPNPWGSKPAGSLDFAPQMGTSELIQNNDSRVQDLIYRNGTLWASQAAFLPAAAPTRTAAQWWEFNTAGAVQQFGRVDDAGGNIFYAFPSIAVNANSDVLLGFSVFSATTFAGGGYVFRDAADAVGTMRDPVTFKAGEAIYVKRFSGSRNRWGDYSSTVVDPVNDTDFWTIQEYASSPNFPDGDNRWGTWWAKVQLTLPAPQKRRGQTISD